MKFTGLAFLTIFAASSSAFGLNRGANTMARSTRAVSGFKKPAMVQAVDIHGNRMSSDVVSQAIVCVHVCVRRSLFGEAVLRGSFRHNNHPRG